MSTPTEVESPELLRPTMPVDASRIAELRRRDDVAVVDTWPDLALELFRIELPHVNPGSPEHAPTLDRYMARRWSGAPPDDLGIWAFLPWRAALVHIPDQRDFRRLRTARNQFLITPEEQQAFAAGRVAVAGLSVGLSVVTTLVLTGGPEHLRIADPDILSLPNLNRLPGSIADLGASKTAIAARRLFELNPYLALIRYPEGLSEERLDDFLAGPAPVDLFVEEMDDIRLKIMSRIHARRLGIPVIMATDNGDGVIIDVERFDHEPDRPLFHGRVPEAALTTTPSELDWATRVRLANAIVGPDVVPRMQNSLELVGAAIPMWPQLGTAATMAGPAIAYVARRILAGDTMPSGRYTVSLEASLDADHDSSRAVAARAAQTEDFIKGFELIFGEGPQ